MLIWLILLAVAVVVVFVIHLYRERYNKICYFTGGLGSGKKLSAVEMAVYVWKKRLLRTKIYNFFKRKKNKLPLPKLYTSIPVEYKKGEFTEVLDPDILQKYSDQVCYVEMDPLFYFGIFTETDL